MKNFLPLIGLALLLLANTSLVAAVKDFTSQQAQVRCQIPGDWPTINSKNALVAVRNDEQTKSFVLSATPVTGDMASDNPAFLHGIIGALEKNGSTITSQHPGHIRGLASYTIDSTMQKELGTVYTEISVVVANSRAYGITINKLGSPPQDDPELKNALDSFDFIGTPKAPIPRKEPIQIFKEAFLKVAIMGIVSVIVVGVWWVWDWRSRMAAAKK